MIFIKLLLMIFLFLPVCLFSESIWDKSADVGYWFYKDPIFFKNDSHKLNCADYRQWSISCGFVDPMKLGLNKNEAFLFEQKEYRELLHHFSMSPHDHEAVLQWQKFNHWVLAQAMAASYVSEFNIVQHPELDSTVLHPISQFGNLIIKNMDNIKKKNLLDFLSRTSLLVFFTRSDCGFCHYQADIVRMLGEKTKIPVWNASLDAYPLKKFNHYLLAPDTLKPAQYLHVSTVPTLFLYLAPQLKIGSQEHWIRLSTGLTSADIIESRLLHFVKAYHYALVKK